MVYADSVQDMVVNDTDGKLERMSSKATKSTWASRKTMKAARLATPSTTHGLTGGRVLGVVRGFMVEERSR